MADLLAAVNACQYAAWYPKYANLAFKSIVIPLPMNFAGFLEEDGIVLSDDTPALPKRATCQIVVEDEDLYRSDFPDASSDSSDDQPPWSERFPDVLQSASSAIEQLGGRVVPKLMWSTPTDAVWVSSSSSLLCTSADQVMLLLKSSDRIGHDLSLWSQLHQEHQQEPQGQHGLQQEGQQQQQAEQVSRAGQEQQQEQQSKQEEQAKQQPGQEQRHIQHAPNTAAAAPLPQLHLALRCWYDLRPERELRCFVQQHHVVAVSQRDVTQYFPQLLEQQEQLAAAAGAFHKQHIGTSFPVPDYSMDLYIATTGTVRIVDFNPIYSTTSSLLFTWDELPYPYMKGGRSNGEPASTAAAADGPAACEEGSTGDTSTRTSSSTGVNGVVALKAVSEAGVGEPSTTSRAQDASTSGGAVAAASGGQPGDIAWGSSGDSGGQASARVAAADRSCSSNQDAIGPSTPVIRVVEDAGRVRPGTRVVTGMPFDMLDMQASVEEMLQKVQHASTAGVS